jgi:hypothetical protein
LRELKMFKRINSLYPKQFVKPGISNMEFEPFLSQIPDALEFLPRDMNLKITQSNDFLFLAGIISGNYGDYIRLFTTAFGIHWFLREREEGFIHPIYDLEIPTGEPFKEKAKIGRNTLRKAFRDRFFYIRKEVHKLLERYYDGGEIISDERGGTFKISGNTIAGEGATAENLLKIAKRIKPSIEINNDPFLHRLKEQNIIDYDKEINCPPKSLICPYDGVVKQAYASISSPGRYGTLTGYAICPKCFGVLKSKILVLGFR